MIKFTLVKTIRMAETSFYLALFALLFVGANSQILGLGPCPNLDVQNNFNVARYLGKWYNIERFNDFYAVGNCSQANYGPVDTLGNVGVVNSEIVNGSVSTIMGTARLVSTDGHGKLNVTLITPGGLQTAAPYWVLGTDYTSYSLVWSCENLGQYNIQFSWILGRARTLPTASRTIVNGLITLNGLKASEYNTVLQTSCSLLP